MPLSHRPWSRKNRLQKIKKQSETLLDKSPLRLLGLSIEKLYMMIRLKFKS